ncbi:MAG: type IV toxin-antitoxin system AbiEi family antitoxin domain-containing protein [Nevskiales bacterium]
MKHCTGVKPTAISPALSNALARGPVRAQQLREMDIPRIMLTRMVRSGQLKRIARGVYAAARYQPSEHQDLVRVASHSRTGVFCLLTALRFHQITTQSPHEVWLAIPNKARASKLAYPPLRIVRFSGPARTEGIEQHRVDGITLRVYSVAKTVADCFKYRHKIGLDVALEALRESRRERRATIDELWQYAKICRVANVMRPYLESVE